MPTIRKDRENRWMGRVLIAGHLRDSKMFGAGPKHGPEWKRALAWEANRKDEILREDAQAETQSSVPTLLDWVVFYLEDAQRRRAPKTFEEKQAAMKRLLAHAENLDLNEVTPGVALAFLQSQYDNRTGYAANKDRKNLAAAWKWGRNYLPGFPLELPNPFEAVAKFPEIRKPRYVPPEDDFWKAYSASSGQDRVMLTAMYYMPAGRKSDFFKTFLWPDVDFKLNTINLWVNKVKRRVPYRMHAELRKLLLWWWEARSLKDVKNVFYCINIGDADPTTDERYGKPFKNRGKFLKALCYKARVKRFDFHSIRHRRAVDLYLAGNKVATIQRLLAHSNASTTERYLKSLGLDLTREDEVIEPDRSPAKVHPFAKGEAPEAATSEASCNQPL